MIYDVTLSDGGSVSVSVSLTYRPWIPGRDSWMFSGGSAIAGVAATDWEIVKAAGRLNMFASFSGNDESLLFTLTGFGNLSHDPAVGDSDAGFYSGPAGSFGQADSNAGIISWSIDNVR